MLRTSYLILLLFVFLAQGLAQPGSLRVETVFLEKFPDLEIVVESNSPFKPQDLILLEDGKATVTASGNRTFKETERGMAILVLLDVSGTMTGQPLNNLKKALTAMLTQINPHDRIALFTFADDLRLEAPFGADPETLKKRIAALQTRGSTTRLYKFLFDALSRFDAPNLPARKRLIVISDGKDEGQGYKPETVLEQSRNRGIPIDAIGLTRINPDYLEALQILARNSGGSYAQVERPGQLEEILKQGIARLQDTPVVLFKGTTLQPDGQEHRLGVRLDQPGQSVPSEVNLVLPRQTLQATPPNISPPPKRKVPVWGWWLIGGGGIGILLLAIAIRRRRSLRRARHRPKQVAALKNNPVHPASEVSSAVLPPPLAPVQSVVEDEAVGSDNVPESGDLFEEKPQPQRRRTNIRTEFSMPTPDCPTVFLRVEEGPLAGKTIPVTESLFWIGSEPVNSLCITGDNHLSGVHTCIKFEAGTLFLYDNQSTNGTFLNDERLAETLRPLSLGDRIKAGRNVFLITQE